MSAQLKRTLMAKIHIAKKQLSLCDDTYRDVLTRVTGKKSCAKMTVPQLIKVSEEFKSLGFKPKPKSAPKRAGTRKQATHPQASKIRALWLCLYHLGLIKDPTEQALSRFVTRMSGVEDLEWLTPHHADVVIKALRGWLTRKGWTPPSDYDGRESKSSLISHQCAILEQKDFEKYLTDIGFDLEQVKTEAYFGDYKQLDHIIENLGKKIRGFNG